MCPGVKVIQREDMCITAPTAIGGRFTEAKYIGLNLATIKIKKYLKKTPNYFTTLIHFNFY